MLNNSIKYLVFAGKRKAGKAALVNSFLGKENHFEEKDNGKIFDLSLHGPSAFINVIDIDKEDGLASGKLTSAIKAISEADAAVIIVDSKNRLGAEEIQVITLLDKISVPYVLAVNKIEFGVNPDLLADIKTLNATHYEISCKEDVGIDLLKKRIIRLLPQEKQTIWLKQYLSRGDIVALIIPDDYYSVNCRLPYNYTQIINEALAEDYEAVLVKEKEIEHFHHKMKFIPKLIIADLKSVNKISMIFPDQVKITSFILSWMNDPYLLTEYVKGVIAFQEISPYSKILILEACNEHRRKFQENFAEELKDSTIKNCKIDYFSGKELPDNLADYNLIIHCEGCGLSLKSLTCRVNAAKLLDIPIVNFELIKANRYDSLPKVLTPFEEAFGEWKIKKG